jgi:hypothetical protein
VARAHYYCRHFVALVLYMGTVFAQEEITQVLIHEIGHLTNLVIISGQCSTSKLMGEILRMLRVM